MTSPPHEIEQRLAALIPRVRALRVARGSARLVAAGLAATALLLLLDAGLGLPPVARGLLLSVWLTGVGVLTWRWVVAPWLADVGPSDVAREVECRLPELGARLLAAVAERKGGHPEPVRAAVDEDTARRLKSVDLAAAFPAKRTAGFACAAAGAVAAALLLSTLTSGSAERLRRVAMPWAKPAGASPYSVRVTSGEPVVRRGGSVTLSAFAERTGPDPAAPAEAALMMRTAPGGPESRHPMSADGAAYHFTVSAVLADFDYCVDVGGVRSAWHRVAVLDAVELAEGTRIELAPPAYANQPKRTANRFSDHFPDLEGLQYSTAQFRLAFNRPAAAAHLDWRPEGTTAPEVLPLALTSDRRGASATFLLRQSGVLKLVLVSEEQGRKLRTETAANVRAIPDGPPRFEQLTGLSPRPRAAKPTDRVRIEFIARDDLSVSQATLVYVVGPDDSRAVRIPVPLAGAGTTRATGAAELDLTGKAAEGEVVRLRLVLADNYDFDEQRRPGPPEARYPREGWSEVRVNHAAPSLDQQAVTCQRDALSEALAAAQKELGEASGEVGVVRAEDAGRGGPTLDQNVRINNAREKARAASGILTDATAEAALTVELRPLADTVRAIAERDVQAAEESLRKGDTDKPDARAAALAAAAASLDAARVKLRAALDYNGRFAQARLDRLKLSALAANQALLAADGKAKPAERLARQRELLARLERLVAESEPLRAAAASAKAAEVSRLARESQQLLDALRELDAAVGKTAADARDELLAAVARDQEALAKQAAALFTTLETACRLAGVPLPRPEDFRRVAELAAAGKTVDALSELEKHAQALDRIAAAFEQWSAERTDPKLAAKQLARWQEDLLARLRAATKGVAFAALPEAAKAAFRAEQKALADAAAALGASPDPAVKKARGDAAFHSANARRFLQDAGEGAGRAMELAAAALTLFAEKMPTVPERLTGSLREIERLRQELESSGNAVEAALKSADKGLANPTAAGELTKKLAPQAERQRKVAYAVATLDLPGLAARQARAVRALESAVSDMRDGAPFDVQASQQWARREVERLKLAAEGHSVADAKVEEVYRKLAALVDAFDAAGDKLSAKQLEPAAPLLGDAGALILSLPSNEAAVLTNDARLAVGSAVVALRDPKPAVARQRIRLAVEALGRLSDRLNNAETDLDRVRRLAALRRVGAEKPKELLNSDEAPRQLLREVDELSHTRVGLAGQVLKKRAIDLYAKLRGKGEPDRLGTDLKSLATTLDELAAKMADVAELATSAPRDAPPVPPSAADSVLPSKALAESVRELARQQRALQTGVSKLPTELTNRLSPGVWSARGQRNLLQVAAADALGRGVAELVARLAEAVTSYGPADEIGVALGEATKAADGARKHLAEAVARAATGNAVEAAKSRAAAGESLAVIAGSLAEVAPAPKSAPCGDALRAAERAMRTAAGALAAGDNAAAADAMRNAARGLEEAAKAAGE